MRCGLLLVIFIVVTTNLSGDICWNESGALVYKSNNLCWDEGAQALSDGDFLNVWSDAISERQQVKAMKLHSEATNAWFEPVILNTGFSISPCNIITREVADGVIVCWLETGEIIQVNCQKIDLWGNKLWGEEGLSFEVEVQFSDSSQLWIIEGNDGGAFIVWHVFDWPQELCGIYLDSEGNACPGWSEGGDVIFTNFDVGPISVISDGFGGLVIAWISWDLGYGVFQRCTSAGEVLWGNNGIELPFNVWNWQIFLHEPGEYYILYSEYHNFLLTGLDEAGQLLFESPEPVFSIPGGAGDYYSCKPSSDGGYIFVWSESNLARAQKIVVGEEPLWGEDGLIIGDNISNYSYFCIVTDNNGGL